MQGGLIWNLIRMWRVVSERNWAVSESRAIRGEIKKGAVGFKI